MYTQEKLAHAIGFHKQGLLMEAKAMYESIIAETPNHADALHLLGVVAAQSGNHQIAVSLFTRAIAIHPTHAAFHMNLGNALQELNQLDSAIASFDKALGINPDIAEAHFNRGNALMKLMKIDDAITSFDRAIYLRPAFTEAHFNRGNALLALNKPELALACYDTTIRIRPNHYEALNNRGHALKVLHQPEEAAKSYLHATNINPGFMDAHFNAGLTLQEINKLNDAISCYDKVIALKPDHAIAHNNRGVALLGLSKFDAAIASYEKAISINPDYAEAHSNLGTALQAINKPADAVACFERSFNINPDREFLFGMLLHTKMKTCDWRDLDSQVAYMTRQINESKRISPCLPVLNLIDQQSVQRKAAEIWSKDQYPSNSALGPIAKRERSHKIRIAYFSADFRQHPVSILLAELFELHNKDQFELIAFSYGPDSQDAMRLRIKNAFNQFIDVRDKSDKQIAALSREMKIDIAVDLGGHTTDSRVGIFSYRAAPIQVSYLGYPGTTGTDYMDYLLADPLLVTEQDHSYYTENIVSLPSYQPNDRTRIISDRAFTRRELKLPESGFVFCCFNEVYKINPAVFGSWMRILKAVPGSVLWLRCNHASAIENLRRAAQERGIEPTRLIFAERVPTVAEHLARQQIADLFLDTLPYNAHTTASDALWAGLPILTRKGKSFTARVAASVLTAIGLPELITETEAEYEAMAIDLATNPDKLKRLKSRLAQNRTTTPLFDTDLYTRHLEAAYRAMYEYYLADEPATHINIA